ncbi:MAG: hypothetical protein ABI142_07455, partial [Bryocella sp.]
GWQCVPRPWPYRLLLFRRGDPMVDIDEPEHPLHSWRDFFIHIATIVVGLVIAVGLEQTVEFFHQRHVRQELRADLRAEAQQQLERLRSNEAINANNIVWYRGILKAGREAPVVNGMVTLTVPNKKETGTIDYAVNGVWPAAKASGAVSVLSRDEIELWDGVGDARAASETALDAHEVTRKLLFAQAERDGFTVTGGTPLHLTTASRDELMRNEAQLLVDTLQMERSEANWEGFCDAILNGAKTVAEVRPYQVRAVERMPK